MFYSRVGCQDPNKTATSRHFASIPSHISDTREHRDYEKWDTLVGVDYGRDKDYRPATRRLTSNWKTHDRRSATIRLRCQRKERMHKRLLRALELTGYIH